MGRFLSWPPLIAVKPAALQGVFSGPTDVEVLSTPDMFALASPLIYRPSTGPTITIPKGTTTDFASTPKALQWIGFLDINGDSRLAGALHDGGYRLGRAKGKAFWDDILYEACLDCGLTKIEAHLYWQAVHWFGGSGWSHDGAQPNYGSAAANFIDQASYDAYMAAGGSVFS